MPDSPEVTVAPRVTHWAWAWAWGLAPALPFLLMVLAPPLNHDVAAVLQFSQRWLAGAPLYRDLIDVNPPLVFILSLVPAWIAAHALISATLALQACMLAYGAWCWRLAWRVRARAGEGRFTRAWLDFLPPMFLLGAGYDFGQREHLMAVAALPYLLAAARRARGEVPPARVAIAITAALGFALKPHFLGIPALVELALLARQPRAALRDPVPWILAAIWLAYLALLPLLFPAYLDVVLPLARDLYLDLGGKSGLGVLLEARLAKVVLVLLPVAILVARRGPRLDFAAFCVLAALGALAAAMVQHKGWSYHIVPIEHFTLAAAAALLAAWLDRLPGTLPPPPRIAALLLGIFGFYVICNGEAPWKELDYRDSELAHVTALLRQAAPGGRVLVLGPGIYPEYPGLNDAGATNTLMAMDPWMLEGAYATCPPGTPRYHDPSAMGAAEALMFHRVAADFAARPPDAVLVDTRTSIPDCAGVFDFVAYFSRNPVFAAAWARYHLVGQWQTYQVFARQG